MARFRIKDYSKDPVLLASDFRCAYCGLDLLDTLEAFVSFSRDHVQPKMPRWLRRHEQPGSDVRRLRKAQGGRPGADG